MYSQYRGLGRDGSEVSLTRHSPMFQFSYQTSLSDRASSAATPLEETYGDWQVSGGVLHLLERRGILFSPLVGWQESEFAQLQLKYADCDFMREIETSRGVNSPQSGLFTRAMCDVNDPFYWYHRHVKCDVSQ